MRTSLLETSSGGVDDDDHDEREGGVTVFFLKLIKKDTHWLYMQTCRETEASCENSNPRPYLFYPITDKKYLPGPNDGSDCMT